MISIEYYAHRVLQVFSFPSVSYVCHIQYLFIVSFLFMHCQLMILMLSFLDETFKIASSNWEGEVCLFLSRIYIREFDSTKQGGVDSPLKVKSRGMHTGKHGADI